MTKLHLVMPMGGKGQRFFNDGFVTPKPLIEIHDRPFFYWATMSIRKFIPDCDISFVVLREHIEKFHIAEAIKQFFPEASIIAIPKVLDGAVLTCMEGVRAIDDDLPVLFNDCDHMFQCNSLTAALEKGFLNIDGALVTFKSNSSQFSYVRCDNNGIVLQTVEKEVISSDAICGAYCFRNKRIFIDHADMYLKACKYSEYFMSGVYNCMAQNKLVSRVFNTDFHISFGTPAEYYAAESSDKFEILL